MIFDPSYLLKEFRPALFKYSNRSYLAVMVSLVKSNRLAISPILVAGFDCKFFVNRFHHEQSAKVLQNPNENSGDCGSPLTHGEHYR